MKYIVTITLWYDNNIFFEYDTAEDAANFLVNAAEHMTTFDVDGDKAPVIRLSVKRSWEGK